MSVLVNSDRMPESGGPIYAEACDYCLGRVCMKLTHAGIEVSGLGADDHDDHDVFTPPVVTTIIDRLPDTAFLITDMHPLSGDPENGAEPVQCGICDHVATPDMMAVLVDDNHMPDSGGPTYAEACNDCIDWLCGKLADAGIGVDVED
ncbi:hypothetical protein [Corynebacterium glyciniphilum]|uniref:hypothetical protein n=1 Tax=Corynebacterium glyciniphilum TaxID=1404244 RepID=UPI0011AB739D|nr:hypothetical protein [Corynebacterium glyciniphilum]